MGKLAERLADEKRTGVYRTEVTDALEEAAGIVGLPIVRVDLRDSSGDRLLADSAQAAVARPLAGWDAFAAALADPAWTPAPGRVLLIEGFEELLDDGAGSLEPLVAALDSAAAQHRLRGERFFAVFLDPGRRVALEPLYDRRRLASTTAPAHAAANQGGDS